MRLKKAIIIIENNDSTNARWLQALDGNVKAKTKESIIVCSSFKIAEKLFSAPRLNILQTIISEKPESIKQLAKMLKKDFKNVYNDVIFLSDLGLLELIEQGIPKALKPIPKYSGLELKLAA